jgi:hypothetical protein
MADEWISAAEAFKLVAAATSISSAQRAICVRANAGLIRAKAMRFMMDGKAKDDFEIPKEFWWAGGEAALEQNWQTGDFETWIDRELHLKAFGVTFLRADIEALAAPGAAARQPVPDPPTNSGGRPAAAWWDDLWVEMARQLYVGDLQPKRQADIESAMMVWAGAHGHSPAVSTIRERASKLWNALRK